MKTRRPALAGTVPSDRSGKAIAKTGKAGQPTTNNPLYPPATACFEMRAQDGPLVLQIQVSVNVNLRYPESAWYFLDGEIRGDICTDTGKRWRVGSGFFGGKTGELFIAASQVLDTDGAPANPRRCYQYLLIEGFPSLTRPPNPGDSLPSGLIAGANIFTGNFSFPEEGLDSKFPQTTLFKGWKACWQPPKWTPPPVPTSATR
jgi:hypothetical protein